MKTIASLSGVDFLRRCNQIRHKAADLINRTGILEIRKHMPTIDDNANSDERKEAYRKQSLKNISDMLDALLDTHPEETYELLKLLCVFDDGEGEPNGIDILSVAFEIISSKKVLDFLSLMGRLGQPTISE